MSRRFKASPAHKLKDPVADEVRRRVAEQIEEIHSVPLMGGKLFKDILLTDGANVILTHGFGRPVTLLMSPLKQTVSGGTTTGRVVDRTLLDAQANLIDRNNQVVLRATGFTNPMKLDIWVF